MNKAQWKLKMDEVRAAALAAGATYRTRYTEPRRRTRSTKFWDINKIDVWKAVAESSGLSYTITDQNGLDSIRFRIEKSY